MGAHVGAPLRLEIRVHRDAEGKDFAQRLYFYSSLSFICKNSFLMHGVLAVTIHENIEGDVMKTQQWEYLVVYLQDSDYAKDQPEMDVYLDADKFTDQMNKYGQAGWELVSFAWTNKGAQAAFKRPTQEVKRKKAVTIIDA
jgi:hypothetical protein